MKNCMSVWYALNSTANLETKNVDIITLGCSKNLVDSECLMGYLESVGCCCRHDPDELTGEIAVVNTCGFIGDAKEESINTILSLASRKADTQSPLQELYVMGCLSQRYRDELQAEIPEVDGWFGKFDYLELAKRIAAKAGVACPTDAAARHITTPGHYAYIKISEGCNRMCSYCAIPLITGHHVSRPMEEILDEMRMLIRQGVKEFNIIAQDLSSYGLDLYHKQCLSELVEKMAQLDGIEWIRLHYAYPTDFPDGLTRVMARYPQVCKYLDIALQHCTDRMLSLMHRRITRKEQDDLIARIRSEVPGIVIRTTLMTGHPGETEEDFEELKQWIQTMRFERMGVFAYSDEDGTYANLHYADDIPQATKQARVDELMAIQQDISSNILQQMVGTVQRIVIDRQEGGYFIGRTQYDSPDVDCEVLLKQNDPRNRHCRIGEFYNVTIIKSEAFDLYATL